MTILCNGTYDVLAHVCMTINIIILIKTTILPCGIIISVQIFAEGNDICYIETSAKDDINVKQLFEMLAAEIVKTSSELQQDRIKLEHCTRNPNTKCF